MITRAGPALMARALMLHEVEYAGSPRVRDRSDCALNLPAAGRPNYLGTAGHATGVAVCRAPARGDPVTFRTQCPSSNLHLVPMHKGKKGTGPKIVKCRCPDSLAAADTNARKQSSRPSVFAPTEPRKNATPYCKQGQRRRLGNGWRRL